MLLLLREMQLIVVNIADRQFKWPNALVVFEKVIQALHVAENGLLASSTYAHLLNKLIDVF